MVIELSQSGESRDANLNKSCTSLAEIPLSDNAVEKASHMFENCDRGLT